MLQERRETQQFRSKSYRSATRIPVRFHHFPRHRRMGDTINNMSYERWLHNEPSRAEYYTPDCLGWATAKQASLPYGSVIRFCRIVYRTRLESRAAVRYRSRREKAGWPSPNSRPSPLFFVRQEIATVDKCSFSYCTLLPGSASICAAPEGQYWWVPTGSSFLGVRHSHDNVPVSLAQQEVPGRHEPCCKFRPSCRLTRRRNGRHPGRRQSQAHSETVKEPPSRYCP